MKISKIHARQILDSRGQPTVEADVFLEDGIIGRAAVPSGASIGKNEALELRDNNPEFFNGRSVLQAVENVNSEIADSLIGTEVTLQSVIDERLIKLDGTPNKSRLGANAILAVSVACSKAAASSKKIPLYRYLNSLATKHVEPRMPLPMMNVMNGGRHANWVTDLQEYIIIPIGARSYAQALEMGANVFAKLGSLLKEYGYSTNVGDEGGYAPAVTKGNQEPLELMSIAIQKSGYKLGEDISFGLDAAASEFYEDGKYHLKTENKILSSEEMIAWLSDLVGRFPIISLEDPLNQEDWEGWKLLTRKLGKDIQIVGDDLFVTNIEFLQKGINEKSANTILIKLNQIGTLTETIQAIELARSFGLNSIVSHRSGETEDTTIAHLAVGLATGQIKTGSLSRTERICKYNELLRIEEELADKANFSGWSLP